MSEREYAVWVLDSAADAEPRIIPVGDRYQARRRVAYYQALNLTRKTYGIAAKVVFKYAFTPDMDWEDA